ncbi:hypothetical protein V1512DRAFT_246832 [Lipomyces arxii]|uniref:uncharacterized protein n=1 Tax=Lipomyces arxii TaxID=56418 RepID=UPI0034CDD6F3
MRAGTQNYVNGTWLCNCKNPGLAVRRRAGPKAMKPGEYYWTCPIPYPDKSRCGFFIYESDPQYTVITKTITRPKTDIAKALHSQDKTMTSPIQKQALQRVESGATLFHDEYDDSDLDSSFAMMDEEEIQRLSQPTSSMKQKHKLSEEPASTPVTPKRERISELPSPPPSGQFTKSLLSPVKIQQERDAKKDENEIAKLIHDGRVYMDDILGTLENKMTKKEHDIERNEHIIKVLKDEVTTLSEQRLSLSETLREMKQRLVQTRSSSGLGPFD